MRSIIRIKSISINKCRDYGLKTPEFYQEEDFRVVIWRTEETTNESSSYQSVPKGELKGELKSIELIYALMKENPKITIPLMITKSGKSRTTIQKCIKKLKEEKIVKRIGSKKGGYWEILK